VSFLDPPPLAFAHRGGAAAGDENTAEAFGRAIALGYRYLETDVHATADGVPVVLHDPDLERVSGTAGLVAQLRWADLATVRVSGAAAVPRLDDVLAAWPQTRFNIDVKADPAAGPAVAAVRAVGAADRVLLASFDDRRLARLRALAGPAVVTSLGRRAVARLRAASLAGLPFRPAATVVAAQVPMRYGPVTVVDRRLLSCAHRAGLQVHVWTVDEPDEMRRLLDMGVDGIMTDRVEALRDVFAERGLWPPQ
jgi:glycerophosphoryl diester phosphodiesterase